jgi:hypothetical protein
MEIRWFNHLPRKVNLAISRGESLVGARTVSVRSTFDYESNSEFARLAAATRCEPGRFALRTVQTAPPRFDEIVKMKSARHVRRLLQK